MNLRLHVFFCQLLWLFAAHGKSFQGVPGYGRNLIIKALPALEDYQSNVYEIFMEPYLYEVNRPVYPISGERNQKQIDLTGSLQITTLALGTAHRTENVGTKIALDSLSESINSMGRCTYTCFLADLNMDLLKAPRSAPGLQAIVHLTQDEDSGVEGDLIFTQIVPNGPVTIEGNITGLPGGLHGVHVHQTGAVKDNCKDIGPHFIAYYGRHGGPRDHIRHVGDLGNIKAEEGETVNVKIVDHLISLAGPRSIVGRSLAITKGEDDYGRASTEDSALTGTSGPAVSCGIIGYLN